jgi:hypothetical protein
MKDEKDLNTSSSMAKELYVLNQTIDRNQKLVIFGTGKHARELYVELIHYGVKVDYFADRNEELSGIRLFGIEVISEQELGKIECQIIIASSAWKDIMDRLTKIGKREIYVDTARYLGMNIEL